MSKLLRCLAGLFILCFIGNNAFAAGYNCPTYRKYTSCNSGYYLSECDSVQSNWQVGISVNPNNLNAGNSCKSCPSGYSCSGGLVCPRGGNITCRAGYYLPANASSCSACGGNNYYCPGGTFNVSSSAQGRNTVLPGYYSTGGTSTTRTGQAQCTGATYCTGGVKYNCPTGYDDNTRNGKYRSLQCQINCSAGYYLKTARDSSCTAVGIGYYKAAHTVSYGSTSSRTACPTSYTTASTTSGTSINRCYLSVDGGYVRDGTDGTTLKRCFNGTYRGAHNEYYGTTYTCTSCPAYYSNSAAGSDEVTDCYRFVTEGKYIASQYATTETTCPAGYYCTGPAYYGGYGTNRGGLYICTGATYSTSGRGSCLSCPTGYDKNTQSGKTSASQCLLQLSPGQYIASAGDSTAETCLAGYYCPGDGVFYGGYGTNNGGMYICDGAVYSAAGAGACANCPTATSGWTRGEGVGWTDNSSCYQYRRATSISSFCSSGQLRQYGSSSSNTWASAVTEYTAFQADPGAYVSGSGINMTCAECNAGSYSAGGDVHACTACPALTDGFEYADGTYTKDTYKSCVQSTTDPSAANPNCMADDTAANVGIIQIAGSPTGWNGSVLAVGVAAKPGAILDPNFQDGTLYVEGYYPLIALCRKCDVGSYSAGGTATSCTACPELTPGFEYGAGTGLTSYTECKQFAHDPSEVNPYCMDNASVIVQEAGSPTAWDGSTLAVGVSAAPGAILDSRFQDGALGIEGAYDFDNMCTQCGVGTYSAGGTATSCTACPELTDGFEYYAETGMQSYTDCVQITDDPSALNPYCVAADSNTEIFQQAGSPTTWDGVNLAQHIKAVPGAILDSGFNEEYGNMQIVGEVYDFDNMCIPCTGNTYSAGGMVKSCTSCNRDYTISGTALTNHDSASDCKITCSGGEYVPTAGDGCVNVGVGYWGAGGTVSQTSTLGRNACASGLTTIGSGLGADEAGDCGRVLNVGDEKIYLRSTKKTTPSLNISINGDVFYGNMSTATKGSLRINSGGTTYSVYDDSM